MHLNTINKSWYFYQLNRPCYANIFLHCVDFGWLTSFEILMLWSADVASRHSILSIDAHSFLFISMAIQQRDHGHMFLCSMTQLGQVYLLKEWLMIKIELKLYQCLDPNSNTWKMSLCTKHVFFFLKAVSTFS